MNRTYICIDLKSFYASVECNERGLDPLTTNLVVADISRTEKTICLAVSPSLKEYGIPGRARLFEVIESVKKINFKRKKNAYKYKFTGKSYNNLELKKNNNLELDYIVAPPRMSKYIKYSTEIYNIYLKYLSSEDIYVYSIDEVFCDITNYLKYYNMTAEELVTKIINDVYKTTGITATAGIGTNLYLAKVAMDIEAKHSEPNEYGVRIAFLNEKKYRKKLWNHKPLTDFWRIGKGYSKNLEKHKIYTMGDIARTSIENEDLLFKIFGINAELLIDHAWGYEPCTLKDVKKCKPLRNSLSSGQVLHYSYNYSKAKLIVKEMIDSLCLELVEKHLVTNKIVLTVGYDIENLKNPNTNYKGEIKEDCYGRIIPKPAHGTISLNYKTSSSNIIRNKIVELYDKIIDKNLLIKRINISVETFSEEQVKNEKRIEQIDLFSNYEEVDKKIKKEIKDNKKENELQNILLNIKQKYGKNSILRGMDYMDGATTIDRNNQIGGHRK